MAVYAARACRLSGTVPLHIQPVLSSGGVPVFQVPGKLKRLGMSSNLLTGRASPAALEADGYVTFVESSTPTAGTQPICR